MSGESMTIEEIVLERQSDMPPSATNHSPPQHFAEFVPTAWDNRQN